MNAWGAADVTTWLKEQEGLADVAQRASELGVDGPTLLELDSAAWQELGVQSAVQRARLIALSKRQQGAPAATAGSASVDSLPSTTWSFVAKHGENFCESGAAEHFAEWHSAVACAERSGCTDNVLALLVFTIAFTSLFTLRPIGTPAAAASDQGSNATATEDVPAQVAEWLDAINFLLFVLSAIWSFGAINAPRSHSTPAPRAPMPTRRH